MPAGRRGRTTGIGLGLSIVERISTLLSLQREVRSTPGRGSLFAVLVPYGRARRARPIARGRGDGQRRAPSLAIAVIDDDPGRALGLAATLAKWGHRPIAAATATEAVVQFIGADLSPDFIISDYHLAGSVKGDAAIEEVRREFDRAPPAAIMTSDPDPRAARRGARARASTLLAKPLESGRAARAAGAGSPVSSSASSRRRASRPACMRLVTPSLRKIAETCALTVISLICELARDPLVRQSGGQQFEHAPLAQGQLAARRGGGLGVAQCRDDAGRHVGAAGEDDLAAH